MEGRRRVKVLLADDHAMFREGLAGMLGSAYEDQVEVVGETKLGEEAVALAREKAPDMIVMEVDRSLEKARDALERIREGSKASPPKVVILTMFDDPQMVRSIMGLGANALIHKSASVKDFVAALNTTALDGQEGEHLVVAMPQEALGLSALGLSEDVLERDGARSVLSGRELEILLLAARGKSNRQIASQLHIAVGTVKRHLANIYPKMGVGSRSEVVRKALQEEWIGIREITGYGEGTPSLQE